MDETDCLFGDARPAAVCRPLIGIMSLGQIDVLRLRLSIGLSQVERQDASGGNVGRMRPHRQRAAGVLRGVHAELPGGLSMHPVWRK